MEGHKSIIEDIRENVQVIRFNKPLKKNALDINMYLRVTNILNQAAVNNDISMVMITGTGDFYSSGNDFSAKSPNSDEVNLNILKEFIAAFIAFPKLLIAVVNGPAIGIAATTLALCDLVFASENAYFYTPFTKLNVSAEGGSTLTFPKLIGQRKAAEMLLFNHKMSAKEALECGFINRVYKLDELEEKAWEKIFEISKLTSHSILGTKNMLRRLYYDDLLKTNEVEIEFLKGITTKRRSNL